MKKLILFFVTILSLLQIQKTYAQVLSAGEAAIVWTLEKLGLDQALDTAQMIGETVKNGMTAYTQLQQLKQMAEDSLEHFKKLTDIESFEDFMRWNNQQLYMERQVENKFHSIGMDIGGTRYGLKKALEIPGALMNDLRDTATGDFTEAQRRRMYTKLGLSPANYSYVKTWQGQIEKAVETMATRKEVINEENTESAQEESTDMAIVEKPNRKIGAASQWQIMMRAMFRQNDQLKTLNSQMADANNLKAAEVMLEQEKRLPQDLVSGSDYDKVNGNFDL
jgi:hypothetical protein